MAGEIDVLVVFGNRAIVLQAKSKRLTLESRKGNDFQLRDDFKKSIQDSYEQAFKCAKLLSDPNYLLKDAHANSIQISNSLKDIYILCLVSDHYPALSFQARQFLRHQTTAAISPPFVLDVFTLDIMAEMLESPLRLLSYIDRRTKYHDYITASHESIILSYHLSKNLWIDSGATLFLTDDVSTELDIAMLVRREGLPGNRTPDGLLTRFVSTTYGHIVEAIEAQRDPSTIDLGYDLLMLSEDAVTRINSAIDEVVRRTQFDGEGHDTSISLGDGECGLTVHCNDDLVEIARQNLESHCRKRKYAHHSTRWHGICIAPKNRVLRFGLSLNFEWKQSNSMDAITQGMATTANSSGHAKLLSSANRKIGRNEACPCGSGKKFKRCCLTRQT
jgi:hypothetical protein